LSDGKQTGNNGSFGPDITPDCCGTGAISLVLIALLIEALQNRRKRSEPTLGRRADNDLGEELYLLFNRNSLTTNG